jgi:glyoxylase-like metal-dependent hydrolase (beta-lactamase superfamily II)
MNGLNTTVIGYLIISLFFSYSIWADVKIDSCSTVNGYKIYQMLDGKANCFIVEFNHNFIMIDTGRKKGFHELQTELNRIGINQDNLKALILTHAHYDHVENAYTIKNIYGTKIIINKLESDFLERGRNSKIGLVFLKYSIVKEPVGKFFSFFLTYKPVKPDILTEETYALKELGFENCRIMRTPGHTPGSECMIIDNEIVITGDAMVGISGKTLPWYYVSKEDLLRSWKKILDTGSRSYLPTHGIAVTREILMKNYLEFSSEEKL